MPVKFLDNYPVRNLENIIVKSDKKPLYGEIWVYQQFRKFNEFNFLPDKIWYLKHDFNLSKHPGSKSKVEGQVDFLLISESGVLIIEVKGGGVKVDENDCYYSYLGNESYSIQNPFVQVKEYVYSLRNFLNDDTFIYRAVVFPHEREFQLQGPQIKNYKHLFFSKKDLIRYSEDQQFEKSLSFFNFINTLGLKSKKFIISNLTGETRGELVSKKVNERFRTLSSLETKRIKSEIFPAQKSYNYNIEKINSELILNENYEILRGLSRNRKLLIEGGPGTGKTIIAQKFIAENLLKDLKGIFFCANKLLRSRINYLIKDSYGFNPNKIDFKVFSEKLNQIEEINKYDFLIFDEAQEYFDKGLFDLISTLNKSNQSLRILILFDYQQSIISGFKELYWYTDFFMQSGFAHYLFDKNYRCIQNKAIEKLSTYIIQSKIRRIEKEFDIIEYSLDLKAFVGSITDILRDQQIIKSEKVILIHSGLIGAFEKIKNDFFFNDLEELNDSNINILSSKLRYTTPLKFKGLEKKSVILITFGLEDKYKTENFVGVTRAMERLQLIIWNGVID